MRAFFSLAGWSVLLALIAMTGCDEGGGPQDREVDPLPFSTTTEYLTVRQGEDYRPIFIRGINLGVAVPGTQAGELAATYEDYRRWFRQMGDAGFNVVRIYTLHYPRFYRALADHNEANPNSPLYVMHGVWLDEDNPSGDLLDMSEEFDASILEVVDCAHGNCQIEHRFGRAYGDYTVDISPWVMGWIIGREVYPYEVLLTNEFHPEMTEFRGEIFEVEEGEAAEVWFAQRLELLVGYERRQYGSQRPVSVSTWPTLDPLDHKTEGSLVSTEDIASFDISKIEVVDAPGGIFATYHAYPYYPDYIPDDPDYREFEDDQGPNSYLGYLARLRGHYEGIPLFIGEFGVPSSWGSAHWGYENMDHGGHDEKEQGLVGGRLMRTIHDTNCAGGALFSWIDEWWKPTWITDPFDFPRERRPHWHNLMAAEQNFGLLKFEPEEPPFAHYTLQGEDSSVAVESAADAAFFRLKIHLVEDFKESDQLVVGLDTYRDDLGESILPGAIATSMRHEFALVLEGTQPAELMVTLAYDLFGISHGTSDEGQLYRSTPTDGGPWRLARWQNSHPRGSDDGTYSFGPSFHDVGELRVRRAGEPPTSHDAVVVDGAVIEIRIPWSLLNFTDPSQRRVMHDDPEQPGRNTAISEGIAVALSVNGGPPLESDRFAWQTWDDAPPTLEKPKEALLQFSEALQQMPYWVNP